MDLSIQFHGAVLRSTYVDCQYSTIRICDYCFLLPCLNFYLVVVYAAATVVRW